MSWKPLNNFTAGEWTPKLDARSDMAKYHNACQKLENMRVMPYGGVRFRPGFPLVVRTLHQDKPARLMAFVYSVTDRHMLEWSNFSLRVFDVETGAVMATLVSPYAAEAVHSIQYRQINDVVYLVHPDYPVHKLSRYAADNWTLAPVAWGYPALRDENTTDTTLALANTTGTGVTMTASAPLFRPGHVGSYWEMRHIRNAQSISLKLGSGVGSFTYEKRVNGGSWQDSTAWEFTEYTVSPDPNVEVRATANDTSGGDSFVSAPITFSGNWTISTSGYWYGTVIVERLKSDGLTWETVRKYISNSDRQAPSNASGREEEESTFRLRYEAAGDPFSAEVWKGTKPGSYAYAQATLDIEEAYKKSLVRVTTVTDTTHAQVEILVPAASTTATDVWSEGAWSAERGFPRAIGLYEQRLYFAGTREKPNTLWGSVVDDFENFETGTDDDRGLVYTFAATEQNAVQWMESLKDIRAATTGREFSVSSGMNEEPLTASNVVIQSGSAWGAAHVQPVVVGRVILYVDRQAKRVRELSYLMEEDGDVSQDMTLLAPHMTESGVRQVAFARQPDSQVFCVCNDGSLAVLTYERDHDVTAWARWTTQGAFESVAAAQGAPLDEVWTVVRRRINGVDVRQIERLAPESDDIFEGT